VLFVGLGRGLAAITCTSKGGKSEIKIAWGKKNPISLKPRLSVQIIECEMQ